MRVGAPDHGGSAPGGANFRNRVGGTARKHVTHPGVRYRSPMLRACAEGGFPVRQGATQALWLKGRAD
jgi:hypothetical protein